MKQDYLVILLKELVILPKEEVKIEILSEVSKNIIDTAKDEFNSEVLVVAPLNQKESSPSTSDLPRVGVVANIKSSLELSNGNYRVTLRGVNRVVISNYYSDTINKEMLKASAEVLSLPKFNEKEEKAVIRKLKASLKTYINYNKTLSNTIIENVNKVEVLDKLTDMITTFLPFNVNKKLEYMQNINPLKRGKALLSDIEEEMHVLKIEEEIEDNIKIKLNQRERDYILKEKLNEIQNELGLFDLKEKETEKYYNIIDNLDLDELTYKKLKEEIVKYSYVSSESPESSVLRNYLELVLNLPWNKSTIDNLNVVEIKKSLETSHFGLEEIKERILDYVEIKNINKDHKSPIICLIGPPGVGKTTIAKSIASSLKRNFIKIPVGGLNDSLELIGSRRTYLGANPGKIIAGIKKCQSNNPVILIDEVDKMVKDYKADPASTLLEILDQSQNDKFIDNYVEEPFDLSKVLFILTANSEQDIPYALKDRLEIINLNSYTIYEKNVIAKKYLIPKIYNEYNNDEYKVTFINEHINNIINNYTKEAGVRELERVLRKLIRKMIISKETSLTSRLIKDILKEPIYNNNVYDDLEAVGVCNVLAYTNIGGFVNKVETTKYKGSGNIITTGSLGDILNESINVAFSYLKSNYKIDFKNNDVHIHFLESSIKKDGPSAGISIVTALLSLFLNKEVKNNIAFSGEVSLNGNILKVGGIKEKVISAINSKITTIYLPNANRFDILEIPEKYLKNINIKFVKNYIEIYNDIFA